jgi:tetratricopeptide (TPR) repeat protein
LLKKTFFVFLIFYSTQAFSNFETVKILIKDKKFQNAIEVLKKLPLNAQNYYLRGLSYARNKDFDKAVENYEKALRKKIKVKDIFYEMGQANYAKNSLEKAIENFKISANKNYKKINSLYYVGYIYQILENHKQAIKYFDQIIELSPKDKNLKQIAYFQRANSRFNLEENNQNIKKIAIDKIIPDLELAKITDRKSSLISKINEQLINIKQRLGLDPYLMKNGRRVKERDWDLSISHKLVYDSNIIFESDTPETKSTNTDSFYHNTSIEGSYRYILEKEYIITPSLKLEQRYHTNRDQSVVHSNDTYDIQANVNFSYETKTFNSPSSYLAELEYKYTAKDRLSNKERIYNSRYKLIGIGKKFKYFNIGQSTVKFKIKSLKSYTSEQNNNTRTLSLNQIHILSTGKVLVYTFQADLTKVSDPNSSSNNYLFRVDYIWPNILPQFTLNPYFSISFLDTIENKSTRGTEKTFTPGFKLSKAINKNFKVVTGYSFQKKYSKDKDSFSYSKSDFLFDLKYDF